MYITSAVEPSCSTLYWDSNPRPQDIAIEDRRWAEDNIGRLRTERPDIFPKPRLSTP